jgi:hypothetical protein
VSQFQPANLTLEHPPPPDYLAGAVLQGLSRPIGGKLSWDVVKSIVLGAISFGLLPILSWVRGFKRFATAEQQQFLHLAQWVRQNSDHPLARQLESDAQELRPRGMLMFLSLLAAVGSAVWIGFQVYDPRFSLRDLIDITYGVGRNRFQYHVPFFHDMPGLFEVWVFGLAAAYFFHLIQVYLHAQDVKRFVSRFSEIAQAEGINRVKADTIGLVIWPLWLLAAGLFFIFGAPWGVIAMLAGGAQRRYIRWTSRNTRADVAHRLRAMLMRRRPSANVPAPVYLRDRCSGPRCRAEMPRGANYGPRCGTRQKSTVNQVA